MTAEERREHDLMGTAEAASELNVSRSNLRKLKGLPEPMKELAFGPVWSGESIRAFARERRANERRS